ncbi:replication-relaxation family protein [Microbacterium sp. X-17]|uniref:replication-relaxation family protein n=1 Tax=Microbacterium sp. X-17 TaxID=3144404 RepID=UPI0031F49B42
MKKPAAANEVRGVSDRSADRSLHNTPIPTSTSSLSADQGIDSHAVGVTAAASRRVGKLELDVIRMSLNHRDRQIIGSLHQHRFLTTTAIEQWHFADHASPLTAARTSRRVLARLRELGVVTTLERDKGGNRGGSAQHVWHLTVVGSRLVPGKQGKRVREPSTAFLRHEMGVAQVHLDLISAERDAKLRLIDFTAEPACWRTFPGASGQVVTLKPDFFASFAAHEEYESIVFGEYDNGTESLRTIQKKALVYENYWRTGLEVRRSGTFPKVWWIAPNRTRLDRILQELGRTAAITMALHAFATPTTVVELMLQQEEPA